MRLVGGPLDGREEPKHPGGLLLDCPFGPTGWHVNQWGEPTLSAGFWRYRRVGDEWHYVEELHPMEERPLETMVQVLDSELPPDSIPT